MQPSELDDWAARVQAELGLDDLNVDVGAVLDLARDAAHGVARPAAPLTTFIVGLAVGRGMPLADALAAVARCMPESAGADE